MNIFKSLSILSANISKYLKKTTTRDLTSWSILALSIIGFAGIFLFRQRVTSQADVITSIILWITAIAVFMYTRETRDLKHVTQRQLKLSIQPFIRLQWSNKSNYPHGDDRYHIKIVNEGVGTAVRLKMTFVKDDKVFKEYEHGIIGGQRTYLPITEPNRNDFGYGQDEKKFIAEMSPKNGYKIAIKYQDVRGDRCATQHFLANPNLSDGFEPLFDNDEK